MRSVEGSVVVLDCPQFAAYSAEEWVVLTWDFGLTNLFNMTREGVSVQPGYNDGELSRHNGSLIILAAPVESSGLYTCALWNGTSLLTEEMYNITIWGRYIKCFIICTCT